MIIQTPEETLKSEWEKVTTLPFDAMTLHHLNYAVLAIKRYAAQSNQQKWIPVSDKPKISQEYVVTIDLEDGQPAISMAMDYWVKTDNWFYPDTSIEPSGKVLYYQEHPAPFQVVIIPEQIVQKPLSVDEYERITYGQCVHGENIANCDTCNPFN